MPGEEDSVSMTGVYDGFAEALHLKVDSMRGRGPSRIPYDVKAGRKSELAIEVNDMTSHRRVPNIPNTNLPLYDDGFDYFTILTCRDKEVKVLLGNDDRGLTEAERIIDSLGGENGLAGFCHGRGPLVRLLSDIAESVH